MPLNGKRVFISRWQKLDPDDPVWQKEAFAGCNWGLRLDPFLVVDCDSPEAVDRYLAWCDEEGHEPSPYQLVGRRDRRSFWYRRPDPCPVRSGDVAPALEIKTGRGHQCAVPPSVHPDTGLPYLWANGVGIFPGDTEPPADMPPPPVDLLVAKMRYLEDDEDLPGFAIIGEGDRNTKMTSFAGHLWAWGLVEEEVIRGCLWANRRWFHPPLEDAELAKIVRSVTSMPRRGRKGADAGLEWAE